MREGLDFTDIEDNNARTEALAEFVDIMQVNALSCQCKRS